MRSIIISGSDLETTDLKQMESVATCVPGGVTGASGLFVFGDSYTDTGENVNPPYGMTWPGIPGQGGNRSCDGRNEVDYFGMCPCL